MGGFDELRRHLQLAQGARCAMTFAEIEELLGQSLPGPARDCREWWANEIHGAQTQARAWMLAGWLVEDCDMTAEEVTFVRA